MPRVTFILGCTGSGKGALGRELARRTGGEVLSVDSMKVYRRMDIGTAKPSPQVREEIPHYGIDVVEPSAEFSVARYVQLAEAVIADTHQRGRPLFAVGGTALYIKALTEGLFEGPSADPGLRARLHAQAQADGQAKLYERLERVDPATASRVHPNDLRRIVRALEVFELTGQPISTLQTQWEEGRLAYDCLFLGTRRELQDQNHRTNQRAKRILEAGLVEEVRSLLGEADPLSTAARQAVGYAEIIEHLEGKITLEEATEKIKINTRRFAKAQRTWFKRFTRTHWVDLAADDEVEAVAQSLIDDWGTRWSR